MKTAEIDDIVNHWPREAWPNRLARVSRGCFLQLTYEGPDMSPTGGVEIHGDILELAFEASGCRHLEGFGMVKSSKLSRNGAVMHRVLVNNGNGSGNSCKPFGSGWHPTRLAAIGAAIKGLT